LLPPAAAVAAESTTAAAVFLGPRFVDVERPAAEFPAVETGNGFVAFGIHTHLHEPKASGSSGFPVGYEIHAVDRAVRLKHGSNGVFGSVKTEISNKNILHLIFFLEFAEQRIAGRIGGKSGLCERPESAELSNYIYYYRTEWVIESTREYAAENGATSWWKRR
jgi:hypothetical protein